MDVVNADIGSEPAQRARQGIMGAAVKRRLLQVPCSVADPYGVLELVLDIEQPDTNRGREHYDWQMHQQERTDADQPYHGGDDSRDASIGRHRAQLGLPVLLSEPFQVRLASVWMSGIGPTLPSPASGWHGSYRGISCRQRQLCATVEDDPYRPRSALLA